MKRLFIFLACCLPIYLFAQGFGSFSHDQPYFAKDRSSSEPVFPGVKPDFLYWWHAADISTNDPISVWYDKMAGYTIIQTNAVYRPTNTTDGVCFDGTKSLVISPTLLIPTNSSVFVSGYFSQMPHSQAILLSTNSLGGTFAQAEGLIISPTNQLMVKFSQTNYAQAPLGNNSNLFNIGFTTKKNGTLTELVTYTNGVQVSSNVITGQGVSFDVIGGIDSRFNGDMGILDLSLYAYITDIMLWTNATLNASNMTWLNNWSTYTNAPTKTPYWNPDSIAGMFEWWRADQPSIGYTAGGGGHTNGMPANYAPESYNPADNKNYVLTSATPMTWYSAIGNSGRAGVKNNGNSYLWRSVGYASDKAQPTIFFTVVQATNSGANNQAIFDSNTGGKRQVNYVSASGSGMSVYAGSSMDIAYPYTFTNTIIFTTLFNGATSWVRTNGVMVGTGNVGANSFNDLLIGTDNAQTAPFLGYTYELMAYTFGSMTTNDIQTIENMLKAKFGIP